jgi:hypothetical protein
LIVLQQAPPQPSSIRSATGKNARFGLKFSLPCVQERCPIGLCINGEDFGCVVHISLVKLICPELRYPQCPLAFHTCRFEEGVVLYQATTSDLSFTSCTLPSLEGNEINSSGSLRLTNTHLRGMSLVHAEFRSFVWPSEVRLLNSEGTALNAHGTSASSVFLQGTHVEGEVSLLEANISTQLTCREGSTLSNPGGNALNAEACQVVCVPSSV